MVKENGTPSPGNARRSTRTSTVSDSLSSSVKKLRRVQSSAIHRVGSKSVKSLGFFKQHRRNLSCSDIKRKTPRKGPKSGTLLAERPKRQIVHKDKSAGLSWREETELQKALYASLHAKSKTLEQLPVGTKLRKPSSDLKLDVSQPLIHVTDHSNENSDCNTPTPSTCSNKNSVSSMKSPVRAQRKFAQGSRPSSPCVTPVKSRTPTATSSPQPLAKSLILNANKCAKTDDFLTFLCYRGTPLLPSHLDHFNQPDSELLISCPSTPKQSNGSRPDTPASFQGGDTPRSGRSVKSRQHSRATSPDREISLSNSDLGVKPLVYDSSPLKPGKVMKFPNAVRKSAVCSPMRWKSMTKFHKLKLKKTAKTKTSQKQTTKPQSAPKLPQTAKGKTIKTITQTVSSAETEHKQKHKMDTPRMKLLRKARSTMASISKRPNIRMTRQMRMEIESMRFEEAKAASGKVGDKSRGGSSRRNLRGASPVKTAVADSTSEITPKNKNPADLVKTRSVSKVNNVESPGGVSSRLRGSTPIRERTPHKAHTPDSTTSERSTRRSLRSEQPDLILLSYESPKPSTSRVADVPEKKPRIGHIINDVPVPSISHLKSKLSLSSKTRSTPSLRSHFDSKPVEEKSLPKTKSEANVSTVLKTVVKGSFPKPTETAQVLNAPCYHPSPEEFQDPLAYLDLIRTDAEAYGMCKVVPPVGWSPECIIAEDLRFVTQNQYLHKMRDRWGSNVQEMHCIQKHLQSQDNSIDTHPVIGGIELDLPALSECIKQCGGLGMLTEKRQWLAVAEMLKIPRSAQDPGPKLDDAYCKYLLSYESLSDEEKSKIEKQVVAEKKKSKTISPCVTKGKSRPLHEYFRIASNTMSMWFENEPSADNVLEQYWRLVNERRNHVCVQTAHVPTHYGSAFPTQKESPYSRHGWNFNTLRQNTGSLLRHLDPGSDITHPELYVGMLFSTQCWNSNPHALPYISYLHTGADKAWNCVPRSEGEKFKAAMTRLAPDLTNKNSAVWLEEDTLMVSPETLQENGVSVCHTVQKQGEFIVVFPKAFTSNICCGYSISESIHFATIEWLSLGIQAALDLRKEGLEEFSLSQLLVRLAKYDKTPTEVLRKILPQLTEIISEELSNRKKILGLGITSTEKLPLQEEVAQQIGKRRKGHDQPVEEIHQCDLKSRLCYLSFVMNEHDDTIYCLEQATIYLSRKKNIKHYKLYYRYESRELVHMLEAVKIRCAQPKTPPKKKR